jgi:ribokinase
MPHLVGIGSINVDLIVDADAAAAVDLADPRLALSEADIGAEREVDADQARTALGYLAGFDPIVSPGGSALNVCAGVTGTGAPLTVGHVGVCGSDGPPGLSFPDWFRRRGIDTTHVEVVEGPPGLCLAVNRDRGRTLLTTAGVNGRLGRLLTERADQIDRYLGRARLVHLTSLTGMDDLEPLIGLVDRLRRDHPGVRLSCDPGAVWTSPGRADGADEVMARCHQLLVNRRELAAIGGTADGLGAIADRWPGVEMVVVKGADRVDVLHRDRTTDTHPNPHVLGPDEIVDDTGAGDAFAAGFLIGQLVAAVGPERGVCLGMDLARVKLGFAGMTGVDRFAGPYRALVNPGTRPRGG